ncbi:MAG: DGQHR domain-containing protein [Candidatus Moranbacteria bacterium]|nr:DGQHR domain-containing protein [Candidatus Moranbacteria bacterium]
MKIHEQEYIEAPCIQVVQPVGVFYVASIGFKELLEISYADVRRLEKNSTDLEKYIGIQRLLSTTRVKEIANYVSLVDATFPTSVIIEVDRYASNIDEITGEKIFETYKGKDGVEQYIDNIIYNDQAHTVHIRKDKNIARILDGQHRLAGLAEGAKEIDSEKFCLNVSIFIDMDIEDQAIVFSTINKSHTKVNKSLVADLFEYTKTRSPQKTAHNIARALNEKEGSPFYKKINILGLAKSESETITQATFTDYIIKYISGNGIQAMKDRDVYKRGKQINEVLETEREKVPFRNMWIHDKDIEIAQNIWNYFHAVSERWPIAWNNTTQTGLILNRSTGFHALMRFFKRAYLSHANKDEVISKEEFSKVFSSINILDVDFSRENYLPGTSGQKKLYDELIEKSGIK